MCAGRGSGDGVFYPPIAVTVFWRWSIQFRTDINKIKHFVQTTNLGVRSSNLFGRANDFNNLKHILFGDPHDRNGLRTPTATGFQERTNFRAWPTAVADECALRSDRFLSKDTAPESGSRGAYPHLSRSFTTWFLVVPSTLLPLRLCSTPPS